MFDSTAQARDAMDADHDGSVIRDADVLAVPDEGVYGYVAMAWPVAVTAEAGLFCALSEDAGLWPRYAAAATEAAYLAYVCKRAGSLADAPAAVRDHWDAMVDGHARPPWARQPQHGMPTRSAATEQAWQASPEGQARAAQDAAYATYAPNLDQAAFLASLATPFWHGVAMAADDDCGSPDCDYPCPVATGGAVA